MQVEIAKAVAIIRNSPELLDEDIFRRLTETGLAPRTAARIVEFLPAAYCRVLLEHAGVRFAETFQRHRSDGSISPHMPLAKEPIWREAIEFAHNEIEGGVSHQGRLQVAARSAEFQAINNLLKEGSKLEHLVVGPFDKLSHYRYRLRFDSHLRRCGILVEVLAS